MVNRKDQTEHRRCCRSLSIGWVFVRSKPSNANLQVQPEHLDQTDFSGRQIIDETLKQRRRRTCKSSGAGSGNRTRIFSLEGYCSTIELYPHLPNLTTLSRAVTGKGPVWWRRLDSNQRTLSERIYSPSPLTTRTLLRTGRPPYDDWLFMCQHAICIGVYKRCCLKASYGKDRQKNSRQKTA